VIGQEKAFFDQMPTENIRMRDFRLCAFHYYR